MDPTATTDTLAQRYTAILKAEGFDPNVDNDGDITFKFEAGHYIIILDADDPQFFRLCYPAFHECKTQEDKVAALAALNEVNLKIKVGKAFLVKDNCWAVVEAFIPDPGYLTTVLKRYLRIIQLLVHDTFEKTTGK